MSTPADTALLHLADRIPRAAERILELAPPGRSIAGRFRLWNPHAATLTVTCEAPPPPAALHDLCAAQGPFSAVVLHPLPVPPPDPIAVLAVLGSALCQGGTLLILAEASGLAWAPDTRTLGAVLKAAGFIPDQMRPAGGGYAIARAVRAADGLHRMALRAIMLKPAAAVNDKRIIEPLAFQETIPGVVATAKVRCLTPDSPAEAGSARVTILQRSILTRNDLSLPRALLARGHIVVAEFDDHPMVWPTIAENDYLTFGAVHAVQTSTNVLAEVLRPHNPELAVFPNQIAAVPPPRGPRPEGPVRLFFGALNRTEDIMPLMPVLEEAVRRFGDRVAFEVVFDKGLFDALPSQTKNFTPLCPYPVYLDRLRRCDIALLPLADTPFNRCKSDLKYIECAVNEVVALASPCVYAATVRDGESGWLFDTPEIFRDRLFRLIEDPALRAEMALRARAYVLTERLQAQHVRRRHTWYRSLIERKAELDAALYARVPALKPD